MRAGLLFVFVSVFILQTKNVKLKRFKTNLQKQRTKDAIKKSNEMMIISIGLNAIVDDCRYCKKDSLLTQLILDKGQEN